MIFNGIIGSTLQVFGNLSPLIAHDKMGQIKDPLFLIRPVLLLDIGVKMIMPSLSALFTDSTWIDNICTWEVLSDSSPFLSAIFLNELDKEWIFLICPWFFFTLIGIRSSPLCHLNLNYKLTQCNNKIPYIEFIEFDFYKKIWI